MWVPPSLYTVLPPLLANTTDESSSVGGDESTAEVISAATGTGEGVELLAAQLTMLPRSVNRAASEDSSMVSGVMMGR